MYKNPGKSSTNRTLIINKKRVISTRVTNTILFWQKQDMIRRMNAPIKNNEGQPNDNCLKNGRSYMIYGWQISLERMKKTPMSTNQTKARITLIIIQKHLNLRNNKQLMVIFTIATLWKWTPVLTKIQKKDVVKSLQANLGWTWGKIA